MDSHFYMASVPWPILAGDTCIQSFSIDAHLRESLVFCPYGASKTECKTNLCKYPHLAANESFHSYPALFVVHMMHMHAGYVFLHSSTARFLLQAVYSSP